MIAISLSSGGPEDAEFSFARLICVHSCLFLPVKHFCMSFTKGYEPEGSIHTNRTNGDVISKATWLQWSHPAPNALEAT
jgi:hypothetical protein